MPLLDARGRCRRGGSGPIHVVPYMTGYFSALTLCHRRARRNGGPPTGRTWTHTTIVKRSQMRMLLSFQRPPGLPRGASPWGRPTDPTPWGALGRPASIAPRPPRPPARARAPDADPALCGRRGRDTGRKQAQRPPAAGRFRRRRERPPTPGYGPGGVVSRASGGLARGPQAHEAAAADPQDLAVGPLAGDIVLPGGERILGEGHASLVDQPAGLRA